MLSLLFGQAYADSHRQKIEKILPEELVALHSKNSRAELEKKFKSKIIKTSPYALYLAYFNKQSNDVTVGTKKGFFDYIYVELPREEAEKNKDVFPDLWQKFDEKTKSRIKKENEKGTSHEKGREITVDIPEEGMKLKFSNDDNKILKSIVLYGKGQK